MMAVVRAAPVRVSPFPWTALQLCSRESLRALRQAREVLRVPEATEKLRVALADVLGSGTQVSVRVARAAKPERATAGTLTFMLEEKLPVCLEPEPALVSAVVARVLGERRGIERLGQAEDQALAGAAAAIAAEVARRAGLAVRWLKPSERPLGGAIGTAITLELEERTYGLHVWTWPAIDPGGDSTQLSLTDLGDTEIELRFVVAASLADRDELLSLCPGDAWLPGEGWWINTAGQGRALLVAADGETGVWVDLAADGRVVLTSDTGQVLADPDPKDGASNMTQSEAETKAQGALESAVLDAPVVVRVEVGAVSLAARQWAALKPGDVLQTGRRIAEPVTLRIAGREVARGDLVSVEGELGVRIRELTTGGLR
jgi:flagellar motor switch/type III secretory pathway protein FliN